MFTVDGNRAGMVLRMSCARRNAACDRIEVAGILTNDGRGCGSRRKLGHDKFSRWWVVAKIGSQ